MAWLGFGMVLVGGTLVYSSVKNLSPWTEFLTVLKTAKLPGAPPASGGQAPFNPNIPAGPGNVPPQLTPSGQSVTHA